MLSSYQYTANVAFYTTRWIFPGSVVHLWGYYGGSSGILLKCIRYNENWRDKMLYYGILNI